MRDRKVGIDIISAVVEDKERHETLPITRLFQQSEFFSVRFAFNELGLWNLPR
jgi:hypothetical protein